MYQMYMLLYYTHALLSLTFCPLKRRHDIPLQLARYLRQDIVMRQGYQCHWEDIECMKHHIMSKYFDKCVDQKQSCEIFCIESIPAVSMVYNSTNIHNHPNVHAFYMNKGMLLLFDAGPIMRSKLFDRYQFINLRSAVNRNDFLMF